MHATANSFWQVKQYKFAIMFSQPANLIWLRTSIYDDTKSWKYFCWLIMMCLFWSWWVAELIHFYTSITGTVCNSLGFYPTYEKWGGKKETTRRWKKSSHKCWTWLDNFSVQCSQIYSQHLIHLKCIIS